MSGEGFIPVCPTTFGYLRAEGAVPPRFDQRPGTLEAARVEPASGILVTGSREVPGPLPPDGYLRDRRAGRGWFVLATVRGEDGTFCQVALTPGAARKLAGELVELADVLEGHVW